MKKFEAFYTNSEDNNTMTFNDGTTAREVRYSIIARDEDRARELITLEGEDPDDFTLESSPAPKDQLGRHYSERIEDARI